MSDDEKVVIDGFEFSQEEVDAANECGDRLTEVSMNLQSEGIPTAMIVTSLISLGVYYSYQVSDGDTSRAKFLINAGQMAGAEMWLEESLSEETSNVEFH